jgi:ABC-2 type transport system permease protein
MTQSSTTRIGAVIRKELTEFRRSRFIITTMGFLSVIFLITPTAEILALKAAAPSAQLNTRVGLSLLFLLMVPVFIPSTIAAYSVVGERGQGTLEPLLTTPIRRTELLFGKAVAMLLPALGIAYLMFGIFLLVVHFGANAVIASAVWHAPQVPAELIFIPLLAAWAIWVGLAISSRASDVRVAQQLSTLASLPPIAVTALMSFQVITPTFTLGALLAGSLLVIDCAACFFVAKLFERERLVIGSKPSAGMTGSA